MIRLVATDVDGTLVKDGSHVLDPAYYDMIRRLRRKGVYVCVCSGRQYHSIHHLFAPVAGELFFLAENGTLVRTEEKILQTWPIDPDYYIPLIRDIRKIDGAAAVVCSPRIARVEAGEDSEVYRFLKEGYSYMLENIPDLTTIPSGEVLKLSVYHERAEKGLLPLTSSHWADDLALEPSGVVWLDICPRHASKGNALSFLQDHLGIRKEETLYFGDNINDLSAFAQAGLKGTVSNARREVREAADFVGDSYENLGVLKELQRIFAPVFTESKSKNS